MREEPPTGGGVINLYIDSVNAPLEGGGVFAYVVRNAERIGHLSSAERLSRAPGQAGGVLQMLL
jgi:hypothetical protein